MILAVGLSIYQSIKTLQQARLTFQRKTNIPQSLLWPIEPKTSTLKKLLYNTKKQVQTNSKVNRSSIFMESSWNKKHVDVDIPSRGSRINGCRLEKNHHLFKSAKETVLGDMWCDRSTGGYPFFTDFPPFQAKSTTRFPGNAVAGTKL